jgi:hypothetical protein
MIPYNKRLLIKKVDAEKGGLVDGVFVPASVQGDDFKRGVVVEVGQNMDGRLEKDDKIAYKGAEESVIESGDELFLIDEEQVKIIL